MQGDRGGGMAEIIESFEQISGRYRAILCDLWGCYHDGLMPFPAAVAALRRYREAGGLVVLLTNAPRPAASVKVFLDRIGAPADSYDAIMSSGAACQRAMASGRHGQRFHYVGPARDLHMLTDLKLRDLPLDEADAILCTGLEDDTVETPEHYAGRLADWAARGLPMLCANPDIIVDRGETRLWCAGALAKAYEAAGGKVTWFGKPHLPTYDQALDLIEEHLGEAVPEEEIVAVGDGIGTDVKGAEEYGLDVVFVTGGLAAAEMGPDPEHPCPDRLARYLESHGSRPAYAIGRFR